MKTKVNIFDRKGKTPFERVVFKISIDLLYFGYLDDVRFLKPVVKEIFNTLYVF